MSGRFLPILRAVTAATLLTVGPFMVAHFVLENHATKRGNEELRSAAIRYVQRAERVITEAVGELRLLRDRKQTDCSPESRRGFLIAKRKSSFIDSFGLVDRSGLAMCLEPSGWSSEATLLPPYQTKAPVIAIGVIEDAQGDRAAVIGWSVENGVRLVARLSRDALDIDPGPENLRQHMHGLVELSDGEIWREHGDLLPDASENWMSATVRSTRYPVKVTLSAPWNAVWAPVRPLHILVTVAAVAFAIVGLILVIKYNWRGGPDAGGEFLEGLLKQQFRPYFQPVIDIESGRVRGCEMLVRWIKPDGRVVFPGAFMPYAETSGHVIELTRQLMRHVRDEIGPFYAENRDLRVSINLSATHFESRKVVEDVEEIFGDSDIAFEQLVFEVTERQPIADIEKARKIIAEFHSLGVRVALDDVGTGHSGLAYLQKLGTDIVKIDKMFIDTLLTDANAHAIVEKLIDLAENLQMGIIAEGVETVEQIEKLRELGVTAVQGFIFSPALPAKMFIELAAALNTKRAPAEIEQTADPDVADDMDDNFPQVA